MCRGVTYLSYTEESQGGRNSCPLLRSYFIGSCHVGVSKRLSRSTSAIQCIVCRYIFFFWLIRSFVYPTLAAYIVRGPLQFLVSLKTIPFGTARIYRSTFPPHPPKLPPSPKVTGAELLLSQWSWEKRRMTVHRSPLLLEHFSVCSSLSGSD